MHWMWCAPLKYAVPKYLLHFLELFLCEYPTSNVIAPLLCASGTKAGVGHHATAAGQLWAEWEKRHAAGGEEDTGRGDQALESSDPGQWEDNKNLALSCAVVF